MGTAVLEGTNIQSDLAGRPVSWTSQWALDNYNGAATAIPMFGDILKMAYAQGARVMMIDGISVYHTGTIGVVLSPFFHSGATNLILVHHPWKATVRNPDIVLWDTLGWPLSVSEALQKPTIGGVQAQGYAATDDMTIIMWGRFR